MDGSFPPPLPYPLHTEGFASITLTGNRWTYYDLIFTPTAQGHDFNPLLYTAAINWNAPITQEVYDQYKVFFDEVGLGVGDRPGNTLRQGDVLLVTLGQPDGSTRGMFVLISDRGDPRMVENHTDFTPLAFAVIGSMESAAQGYDGMAMHPSIGAAEGKSVRLVARLLTGKVAPGDARLSSIEGILPYTRCQADFAAFLERQGVDVQAALEEVGARLPTPEQELRAEYYVADAMVGKFVAMGLDKEGVLDGLSRFAGAMQNPEAVQYMLAQIETRMGIHVAPREALGEEALARYSETIIAAQVASGLDYNTAVHQELRLMLGERYPGWIARLGLEPDAETGRYPDRFHAPEDVASFVAENLSPLGLGNFSAYYSRPALEAGEIAMEVYNAVQEQRMGPYTVVEWQGGFGVLPSFLARDYNPHTHTALTAHTACPVPMELPPQAAVMDAMGGAMMALFCCGRWASDHLEGVLPERLPGSLAALSLLEKAHGLLEDAVHACAAHAGSWQERIAGAVEKLRGPQV